MAANQSTASFPSLFPQLLDMLVGAELRRIDRVFQQSLEACSFEDPGYAFPCGRPASVSEIETHRPLCAKHFAAIA